MRLVALQAYVRLVTSSAQPTSGERVIVVSWSPRGLEHLVNVSKRADDGGSGRFVREL